MASDIEIDFGKTIFLLRRTQQQYKAAQNGMRILEI